VVVGDGPLRSHYHRLAAEVPEVTFVGQAADGARPGYYAHSSVYACPATRGSFGITLLESMACGTPPVCSDIPGFAEVVRHEREALRFTAESESGLADALVRLLDDDTLRRRLTAAGRVRVAAYDWTRVSAQILQVYAAVLGHPTPALVQPGI
jgi:phosphatidylinositol alpha-mannosyltransferase